MYPAATIQSNLGPRLKMVWAVMRLAKALIPVGMLWISKLIIDGVVALISPAKLSPAHATSLWSGGKLPASW
jgi:hypothetical protein